MYIAIPRMNLCSSGDELNLIEGEKMPYTTLLDSV